MKIKKPIIAILCSSVAVILACVFYLTYIMPFLNFMVNTLPDPDGDSRGNSVIKSGDTIVDQDKYPKVTANPDDKDKPTVTPAPEQYGTFSEIQYKTYVDFTLPENAKNLLVLGIDEYADLTDTIFIMSIDKESKIIRIISIPRDTYVRYSDTVLNAIKNAGWTAKGLHKLNAASVLGKDLLNYTEGPFQHRGISFLSAVIEGMFGPTFHIDDYVYVNFDGFMEMVNVFGGIYITTTEPIYNQYGVMLVPEGRNKLTPKEALFYVRTRHRYDENGNDLGSPGDNYRKELQINFIKEMISQYATAENVSRLSDILTSLKSSVYHSINSLSEISEYSSVALDYTKGKYYVEFTLVTGVDIDPFNDNASYVEVLKIDS